MPKLAIWHAWCLNFGVLGDPGTIMGHWPAEERTFQGPGLGFYLFLVIYGFHFEGYLGFKNVYASMDRCFQLVRVVALS